MDPRLIQAEVIAIPLLPKPETGLKPMPNFLVFDNQFGKTRGISPNLQTGVPEEVDCVVAMYKIVQREILAPNEIHPTETFMERVLLPSENLTVPVDLLPKFFTYQRIKDNLAIVNAALG